MRRAVRWAGLLSFVAVLASVGARSRADEALLLDVVVGGRFYEAARTFRGIASPSPQDSYLGGFALMALNQPDEAEPPLRAAKEGGFRVWSKWPKVDALLERIDMVRECAPPPIAEERRRSGSAIAVYAGPATVWSRPVLAAVPEFEAVGRSIFGDRLPPVRLYLFYDRKQYERFFDAMFGTPVALPWQDGTGRVNVVLFCEKDEDGKVTRTAGDPETVGSVLHEFGHAWVATYLMERFGREELGTTTPCPWLAEGLADFVASLRDPAMLDRSTRALEVKAAEVARPKFEEIAGETAFYAEGDPFVHYELSSLLVAALIGDRKRAPATILALLEEIGRTGDAAAAVKTVTGKDVRKTFEEVAARFW